MTLPRMIRRAVRSSAARVTVPGSAGSTSSSTENSPVGCSTEISLTSPGGTTATARATDPSSTAAVATVTAPSTPTAEWQSCGMNVRVQRLPPARAGATSVIFGTTFRETSPRFIAGPATRRIASSLCFSSWSWLSSSRDS